MSQSMPGEILIRLNKEKGVPLAAVKADLIKRGRLRGYVRHRRQTVGAQGNGE
jgi:hypothetical protein